jgi:hypothetical protein
MFIDISLSLQAAGLMPASTRVDRNAYIAVGQIQAESLHVNVKPWLPNLSRNASVIQI